MADQTSIERFLLNRGDSWMTPKYGAPLGYRVQIIIGEASLACGMILLAFGLFADVNSRSDAAGIIGGSTGPIIAGVTNILVGRFARKRMLTSASDVKLTPDAALFLGKLSRLYRKGQAQRSMGSALPFAYLVSSNLSRDSLDPALVELVEQASYQYNRAFGLLHSAPEKSPIWKIRTACLTAADEAMSEILHQAAMICRFPESSGTAVALTTARIGALEELSNRLEDLQARIPSITDRLASSSAMESVLEELRLNEVARRELSEGSSEQVRDELA